MDTLEKDLIEAGVAVIAGVTAIWAADKYHVFGLGKTPRPTTTPRHTVTHTVPRTVTHTVTHTVQGQPSTATVRETVIRTVHTTPKEAPALSLSVNGSQFRTNENVTITLTASPSISQVGGTMSIVDTSTGQTKAAVSYGTTLTATVTSSTAGSHTFIGRYSGPDGISQSNPVTVTWAAAANDTNSGYANAAGDTVTLTIEKYYQSGEPGSMFHLQATPNGFSNPRYQFWWHPPGGNWHQDANGYQSDGNYYLNADINGTWSFTVYCLNAGDPQNSTYWAKSTTINGYVTNGGVTPTTHAHTAPGSVYLSVPESASQGQTITLQASSSGIINPLYQFYWKSPSGSWQGSGAYSSAATHQVALNESGTWQFAAYARSASAPSNETSAQRAEYEDSTGRSITVN